LWLKSSNLWLGALANGLNARLFSVQTEYFTDLTKIGAIISNMTLFVVGKQCLNNVQKQLSTLYGQNRIEFSFTDVLQQTQAGTYNSSTLYRILLSVIQGKIDFMIVGLQSNLTNANNENWTFLSPGSGTTWNILDPTQTSILANETPLTTQAMKQLQCYQWNNILFTQTNLISIHFASSMRALEGLRDIGGLYLTGRKYLSIQFDSLFNAGNLFNRTIIIYAFRNSHIYIYKIKLN
jgi:hypothetical protein